MAKTLNTLALDLGAESGRAILGQFDGHRLALTDVHRFANGPVLRLLVLREALAIGIGDEAFDRAGRMSWGNCEET